METAGGQHPSMAMQLCSCVAIWPCGKMARSVWGGSSQWGKCENAKTRILDNGKYGPAIVVHSSRHDQIKEAIIIINFSG